MLLGTLFVIDGTDGSGKKTQTELLAQRLEKEGYTVLSISFPTYGQPSGALVESYLRGDFGDQAQDINPYVASTFYAADRFAQSPKIKQALSKSTVVVTDRYVTANMAHQGGKFTNRQERRDYLEWVYDFEFTKARLPKPTLNIILHVPTEVSMALVDHRGNVKDIHEKNPTHLKQAEETYLEIAELFPDTVLIECCENGSILSREKIHELIWERVSPLLRN